MKRNKQKRLRTSLASLLCILIVGSLLLLGYDFFQRHFDAGIKSGAIRAGSNSVAQAIISIQAHLSISTPPTGYPPIDRPGLSPTLTPTLTPTPPLTSNGTSTPPPSNGTPPTGNSGATLPPGSALPSESTCAYRVQQSSFEPRPDNYTANHTVPTVSQIANLHPWDPSIGMDAKSDSLRRQITGNYTGTTDEILQWTACKWGIDVDIVRAEAVTESYWHQSQLGDLTTDQSLCPPGTWNGNNCYQSYGILQIKYIYNKGEWPMSRDDTAYSAEYMYGVIRACYEGWTSYLVGRPPSPGYPSYHAGDIWGCVGRWFSGSWYDQGAIDYIKTVKTHYANEDWLKAGFSG